MLACIWWPRGERPECSADVHVCSSEVPLLLLFTTYPPSRAFSRFELNLNCVSTHTTYRVQNSLSVVFPLLSRLPPFWVPIKGSTFYEFLLVRTHTLSLGDPTAFCAPLHNITHCTLFSFCFPIRPVNSGKAGPSLYIFTSQKLEQTPEHS